MGVKEFVQDNIIVVPQKVLQSLRLFASFLNAGAAGACSGLPSTVVVRYVRLPLATVVAFQPLTEDFVEAPQPRELLERSIRARYATLLKRDVIFVGGDNFPLCVTDVQPEDAVLTIDTDLEVHIFPYEASIANQFSTVLPDLVTSRLQRLEMEKSVTCSIQENATHFFKLWLSSADIKHLMSDSSSTLVVEVQIQRQHDCDVNVFASVDPVRYPCLTCHSWSAVQQIGSKSLTIPVSSIADSFGRSGCYVYIAAQAYSGSGDFSIAARHVSSMENDRGPYSAVATHTDMRTCHNCGELVPVANYLMHESHCYRHLTKCSTCKKVLLQSEATEHKHCDFCGQGLQLCELKKHLQLAHTPLACSCGYVAEWTAMLDHTSKTCPKRKILCRFCGDYVTAGGLSNNARDRLLWSLSEHESECGSRTSHCPYCDVAVRMKDWDMHMTALHEDRLQKQGTNDQRQQVSD